MRVSDYYGLGRKQPDLDFVDVDVTGDVRVFVDPRALLILHGEWANECRSLVQNFFDAVLQAIRAGRHDDARRLLRRLREPNETHLGLSIGRARGRALGPESADDLWRALSSSEAVNTGLLEDLEDTILMVEGISSDIVSDITTNVIREPLIRYTQHVSEMYGISLQSEVDSGPLWDPRKVEWFSTYAQFPVADGKKLLLVPKALVRRRMDYDIDEYYGDYILERLREVELSANSELVGLLRSGRPRVFKKDLREKYGSGKRATIDITRQYPEVLDKYRVDKRLRPRPPLTHEEIANLEGTDLPDWDVLLDAVRRVDPGAAGATSYHRAVERLLTALLYPALTFPAVEYPIHAGRKRIDIIYVNAAQRGFFDWLARHYAAAHIVAECKNYRGDPENPELDQLSGRFSPSRGQVGLLVCRKFDDKTLFLKRCRDTADDQRGFIIALDDDDLETIVGAVKKDSSSGAFPLLRQRFNDLIM